MACSGKFGSLRVSFTKGKTPVQEQDFIWTLSFNLHYSRETFILVIYSAGFTIERHVLGFLLATILDTATWNLNIFDIDNDNPQDSWHRWRSFTHAQVETKNPNEEPIL